MAVEYGCRFPKYLSSPLHILWWEIDEVAIIMMCLCMCLLFGNIWWILLFVLPVVYSQLKKRAEKGFLKHLLYQLGLVKIDGYPHYYEQEFYE
ncbi:MAG: type IV conjugative transfer system protein TraL [Trichlorobacter sp.]|nr:type IV conjugative transfer system protein TraL [Trichlorobacter sp.]